MIAAAASGGMRDAISILDQLSSTGRKISVKMVQETLGVVSERAILKLVEAILEDDLNSSFAILLKIKEKGYTMEKIWNMTFNLKHKIFKHRLPNCESKEKDDKLKKLLFNFSVTTDGYSCSVTFLDRDNMETKYAKKKKNENGNPIKKEKKKKKKDYEYIEDMTGRRANTEIRVLVRPATWKSPGLSQ